MASRLMPCLQLRRGQVCVPGPNGPEAARSAAGEPLDPFDVADRLARDYPLVYLLDVDAVEGSQPQLDYLQEIARDVPLWVNAGVRTSDQAIDALVTGARRAVLSNAILQGPSELRKAWRLSSELVFEIELEAGVPVGADTWEATDASALARAVRAIGPDHIILSPRGAEPDWGQVRQVAAAGPTWVGGTFSLHDAATLGESGAAGGIFQIGELLAHDQAEGKPVTVQSPRTAPRDDED